MIFFRKIFLLLLILFISGCAEYSSKTKKIGKEKIFYSSYGFALIYDENLYVNKVINKKINNNNIEVMHNFLKKNTQVRITNPINSKNVLAKINKNSNYPKIFNIVISKEVSSLLDLDINNPYVEIIEVKKNKTFIAKEGNTFDEEKNVAEKVPVDEIQVDDLSIEKNVKNKTNKGVSKYYLVINDFYYKDSAIKLKNDLSKKVNINNFIVEKINANKYRLSAGPFNNFNALKSTYISLNNLGFEDLNIYKN